MNNLMIRVASLDHADTLQEIHAAAFSSNAKFFPDDMEVDDEDEELSFRSLIEMQTKVILSIFDNNNLIGGTVISTDEHNVKVLERLFISPCLQGNGYGYLAWEKIEKMYPSSNGWRLRTPSCLINNVCFYVNKCGFSIVRVEDVGNDGIGMYVFTKL
jgi:hypothetical protein